MSQLPVAMPIAADVAMPMAMTNEMAVAATNNNNNAAVTMAMPRFCAICKCSHAKRKYEGC